MSNYRHQLNCLNFHLSEALEEREYYIEKVRDIKKQIKQVKSFQKESQDGRI